MHAASTNKLALGLLACLAPLLGVSTAHGGAVTLPDGRTIGKVDFEKHVAGLLGRTGCSAGACHGSFQGKGGFYLSLFGYSPEKDYQSIVREALGRRINRIDPDQSLILLKATGQVAHGGGKRFDRDSYAYRIIREWIVEGASWQPGSGSVVRVAMTPKEHLFEKPGQKARLKVLAEFADGSREDVSYFCSYRVNDDYVAEIDRSGEVRGLRPGDTSVVATYRSHVLSGRALVPATDRKGNYPKVAEVNYIDREVFAKLRRLNIVPSGLSSDTEFLRRITIDTIGTVPTPAEVRAFLNDKSADKRVRKIEELLTHPMHAALWATKYCDITGNNLDTMEQPQQLRPKRAKMWHDWLRQRFAENTPYDQLVKGILCATSRDGKSPEDWVKESLGHTEQIAKGFETDYARRGSLDLFWRRNNFTLEQMAEHTAVAFLGVRLECAQCHKHPFDRWTQTDYRQYANVFAQVKFNVSPESKSAVDKANGELRKNVKGNRNQIPQLREVFVSNAGLRSLPSLNNPRERLKPRALGGPEIELQGDARETLWRWLVQPDNPYFARSFVNRLWGHYFGIGLVEPVDDFSVANPPSNEKLLDALAQDFIASKYDIRKLERTILLSRTYQLSAVPNSNNVQDRNNFARAYVRRMMAEVTVDVLNTALGTSENYGNDVPAGIRAIEVAPNRIASATLTEAFRIFGRPPRTTTCDCERASEPALPQTLYLMTDTGLLAKMNRGRLASLLSEKQPDEKIVEELFLATLSRFPNQREQQALLASLKGRDRQSAFTDILWALINSREFILNH